MGIIYTMTEIMEWLDAQIAWREGGRALKYFNNHIRVSDAPFEKEIHLTEGIKEIAGVLGAKLKREEHMIDGEIDYFMYKEYRVFQWVRDDE